MSSPRFLLILSLILIATTLRTPITAIGPLFADISATLSLSATSTGIIASLPLLLFALMSPITARMANRWGLQKPISLALVLMMLGLAIRASGLISGLYVGTALVSIGIAIGNVLLPGWVKMHFPRQIGKYTALYVLVMGLTASLFAALAVPVAQLTDWRGALLCPLLMPILAFIVWQIMPTSQPQQTTINTHQPTVNVWRSPAAWAITAYMCLCSSTFYVVINWLPSMLLSLGINKVDAGLMDGALQVASALVGIVLAILMRRWSMAVLAASHALCVALGMAGLILLPQAAWLWCILLGYGGGAVFIIALTLMSSVASHPLQSAALSSMAQFIGYLIASIGPPLAGAIHDHTGSWLVVQIGFVAAALLMAGLGYRAGQYRSLA